MVIIKMEIQQYSTGDARTHIVQLVCSHDMPGFAKSDHMLICIMVKTIL